MTIVSTLEGLSQGEVMRFQASNGKALEAVQRGTPGEAIPYLEEALGIREEPTVLSNYGDALARCGRLADARRAFERAIELAPKYDQAHYNLGVALERMEDLEGARAAYLESIACRVTPAALNNLANVETWTLRLADAEAHYRRAIKHGYHDARWNLSLCLMMRGKWAEAWDLYENRPQMRDYATHPLLWRGEDVAGKTLVVVTEQGLGDTVFAIRYFQRLREMGARLIIACEPTMRRLIEAAMPPTDDLPPVALMERGHQVQEPFDYLTLAMSIPGYVTPDGVLPGPKYLRAQVVAMDGFNVGLCWNGSTVVGPPKERNIPLKMLAPLAAIKGVRLVSLQRGTAAAEMEDCGFEIHDAMATVRDVYDTACVIDSLDLVISVDTLIPHLAAGLGKPVWLMNRYMSCWQWGTEEYDPILYDNVAQVRQPAPREWGPVVERVRWSLDYIAKARAGTLEEAQA